MLKSNLMAIADRSHIHKYIQMAIIDHLAAHGHMRSMTAMAITDRSHIHKYISMAIIDHLAAHGHMRSMTAISFFS